MVLKDFSNKKILVVEDDEALNMLIKFKLEEVGYNIECAHSGEEALSFIDNNQDILLIIDYNLTDMLAIELINVLKERNINQPFIIMTGDGDESLAVEMMKQGALDYVVKELGFIELLPSIISRSLSHLMTRQELEETQKTITESEHKYRSIFNNIQDIYFEIDSLGRIIEISPSIEKEFMYDRLNIIGKTIFDFFSDINQVFKLKKYLKEYGEVSDFEILINDKDDNIRYCSVTCSSIVDKLSNRIKVVGIIRNISERKRLERQILNTVIETEEKERRRFAEDLHDGLGSLLSSIKIYVNLLQSKKRNEEEKEYFYKYTNELIDDAVSNTRLIANKLMPNVLNDYGLNIAIEGFIKRLNASETVNIRLDSNITERLNPTIEIIIYRTIMELMNNTIKHAEAKEIVISIFRDLDLLIVHYEDNGKGFNYEDFIRLKDQKGLGLKNIINRLKSINGIFDITSKDGQGIDVNIELDLKNFEILS